MMTYELFGVQIHDLSQNELTQRISEWLRGSEDRAIVTPNPEFLLLARRDRGFFEILHRADLSLPDGVGLRFAIAALTDERLHHRHTGVDTLETIARSCADAGLPLALVGGDAGVAARAAEALARKIPGLRVEGIDPGRVSDDRLDPYVLSRLNGFAAVAIGLGQGKQERVMENVRMIASEQIPSLRVLIGVGGAFDMISGTKRRAPSWMRASGLEWLWRLGIEPRRISRILSAFPIFPAVVVWDTLKHRRFGRACLAVIPEILRQLRGL